ncbi:MAG: hypothetical protein ACRD4F_03270 [Candidatus Angelobacter sp.]
MLVKVLSFGTNWWARFGRDSHDTYRFTRHAAFFNSTGVRCGGKIRRHWIVSGLIRFNGVGDFNPHLPNRSIGHTFRCSDLTVAFGGNRLLFGRKASRSEIPDRYLVVVTSDLHGGIDFSSGEWKSPNVAVIAASQLREAQEAMLLMKAGDWVHTQCGFWWLTSAARNRLGAVLELTGDEGRA